MDSDILGHGVEGGSGTVQEEALNQKRVKVVGGRSCRVKLLRFGVTYRCLLAHMIRVDVRLWKDSSDPGNLQHDSPARRIPT